MPEEHKDCVEGYLGLLRACPAIKNSGNVNTILQQHNHQAENTYI